MAKAINKNRRQQPVKSVSLSSKQCKDSLKNFCEPGSFAEEIHLRAKTMTPLLKELLDFRPQPYWR
jgi:hypothetical protein